MRLLFDIEADGFLDVITKVHCIGAVDVDTEQWFVWGPGQIAQALDTLGQAHELIGQNIIRYDLPALALLHKFRPTAKITDTMVWARVAHPNLMELDAPLLQSGRLPKKGSDDKKLIGSHSLEAWGHRLGEHKAHFEGPWGEWSQEMQDYMMQDVRTNLRLYRHLLKQNVPQAALDLEHRVQSLCNTIEVEGVPFDLEAATKLHVELKEKQHQVAEGMKQQFSFWAAPAGPNQGLFTPKRDHARLGYVAGAPCSKIKYVYFNPSSRDHAVHVAMKRGWKPLEFTDGGKPKMDETIAASLATDFPEFSGLAEYYMLDKRLGMLAEGEQAWLKHYNEKTKCIHGVINPMGTVTSRASHFNPNLGQVTSAKKPYGKECRALFSTPEGWSLVGADMDGLELRGLAHYLALADGGEYGRVVTGGDPHWLNAQGMGLVAMGTPRDKHSPLHTIIRESGSKRFIYAYVYGCGDEKAGRIIFECVQDAARACGAEGDALFREWFKSENPNEGALKRVGKRVRQSFADRIAGFGDLKQRLAAQVAKRGYVPGLDGRHIPVRSEHSALNFMIQGAGAILCKRWGVEAIDELSTKYKIGWSGEVVPVLWVHDEYQVAVRKGLEAEVGQILVKHARLAGDPYGFRVPLDSKYSVGRNWAETH